MFTLENLNKKRKWNVLDHNTSTVYKLYIIFICPSNTMTENSRAFHAKFFISFKKKQMPTLLFMETLL